MGKRIFIILACLILTVGTVFTFSYEVKADNTEESSLVVRRAEHYGVDFNSMCFADYCMFFVQDINIKYGEGKHCCGDGRSTGILNYSSLQDLCLNELNGGDNGIDCSSLIYIIGKFFGATLPTSTGGYSSLTVGSGIRRIIDAKHDGFGELQVGDVIITKDGSQGHALLCVGEIDGKMSAIHIGSSYMCDHEDKHKECCTIAPGVGVTFCDNCKPSNTDSGQNRRFIRTASIDGYFGNGSINQLDSVKIYRPVYTRELGGGYTGTDYGSGATTETLVSWVQRTGTLIEEAQIVGMPGKFVFDGEPIVLTGRDGLSIADRESLTAIGESIGYGKTSIFSFISTVVAVMGYLLFLYGFLLGLAYIFDLSNNFIDISLMSLCTGNKWKVVDDEDMEKTTKRKGVTYLTRSGLFIRIMIIWGVGILFVSGFALNSIQFILDKIYRLVN